MKIVDKTRPIVLNKNELGFNKIYKQYLAEYEDLYMLIKDSDNHIYLLDIKDAEATPLESILSTKRFIEVECKLVITNMVLPERNEYDQ